MLTVAPMALDTLLLDTMGNGDIQKMLAFELPFFSNEEIVQEIGGDLPMEGVAGGDVEYGGAIAAVVLENILPSSLQRIIMFNEANSEYLTKKICMLYVL